MKKTKKDLEKELELYKKQKSQTNIFITIFLIVIIIISAVNVINLKQASDSFDRYVEKSKIYYNFLLDEKDRTIDVIIDYYEDELQKCREDNIMQINVSLCD